MARDDTISLKVQIGDQDFRVHVTPSEKAFYERVAQFTETTFEEVSGQAVSGGPRAWAMTAFQIACELFEGQDGNVDPETIKKDRARIARMIERIDEVTTEK